MKKKTEKVWLAISKACRVSGKSLKPGDTIECLKVDAVYVQSLRKGKIIDEPKKATKPKAKKEDKAL